MTEELGSIGVKLRVDLSDLDRAEQRVKKTVGQIGREHTISFKVGNVNVTEVQRQIASITRGKVDIKVGVSLPGNAGRLLKLSLIHISEPTRLLSISYAVFCLKKKNN